MDAVESLARWVRWRENEQVAPAWGPRRQFHSTEGIHMAAPQVKPAEPTDRRKNLNSAQAAEYLNISYRTLHKWLRDGIIQAHRAGPRLLRFDADELDEAVSRL